MDSKNCLRDKSISAIKHDIECGNLPSSQICQRLRSAIDREVQKPIDEIDEPYLIACQDLLKPLTCVEAEKSKQPQYEKKLIQKINKSECRQTILKRSLIAFGSAAAILILTVVGDQVLTSNSIDGASTPDEQQYNIAGHVIDPGLVESGNASISVETEKAMNVELDEACQVIDYQVQLPTWAPDGWENPSYYATRDDNYWWFAQSFISESDLEVKQLNYTLQWFSDVNNVYGFVEQNAGGDKLIHNGMEIYLTKNVDKPIAIWSDNHYLHTLTGPITDDELLKMIDSIPKGE